MSVVGFPLGRLYSRRRLVGILCIGRRSDPTGIFDAVVQLFCVDKLLCMAMVVAWGYHFVALRASKARESCGK